MVPEVVEEEVTAIVVAEGGVAVAEGCVTPFKKENAIVGTRADSPTVAEVVEEGVVVSDSLPLHHDSDRIMFVRPGTNVVFSFCIIICLLCL